VNNQIQDLKNIHSQSINNFEEQMALKTNKAELPDMIKKYLDEMLSEDLREIKGKHSAHSEAIASLNGTLVTKAALDEFKYQLE